MESPYFRTKKRTRSKLTPSSPRFLRSASSPFGSHQPLDLLFALAEPLCSPQFSHDNHAEFPIAVLLESASRHFQKCPVFCKVWKTPQFARSTPDSEYYFLLVEAEANLLQATRHMCSEKCFMKAFAPFRDWMRLRTILRELIPVNETIRVFLDGWRYHLVDDTSELFASSPPRTLFIDTSSNKYIGIQSVLNHFRSKGIITACDVRVLRPLKLNLSATFPLMKDARSPLGLLEELFADNPWRLLLSTIFLNRTTRVQVDHVMFKFLQHWPTPECILEAQAEDVSSILQPLGMRDRRAKGIIRFTKDFVHMKKRKSDREFTEDDVMALFYCGDYAYSTYSIFVLNRLDVTTDDSMLATYLEYKRGEISDRMQLSVGTQFERQSENSKCSAC